MSVFTGGGAGGHCRLWWMFCVLSHHGQSAFLQSSWGFGGAIDRPTSVTTGAYLEFRPHRMLLSVDVTRSTGQWGTWHLLACR